MTRSEHLQSARDFPAAVAILRMAPRQDQAIAEMVWGATVAAMSAADPEHELHGHFAPNQQWSFRQAAQRISNSSLQLPDLERCLDNNQKLLHTHFYHGNLTTIYLQRSIKSGLGYVNRIIAAAEQSLP